MIITKNKNTLNIRDACVRVARIRSIATSTFFNTVSNFNNLSTLINRSSRRVRRKFVLVFLAVKYET